jgi:RNA polymerase sigma-70 factor, ECF subfamily
LGVTRALTLSPDDPEPTGAIDPGDAALVERIRAGDDRAFEARHRAHAATMLEVARRIVASDEAALDLVQDTFLAIWERRSTLAIRTNLRAYLITAVRNRALNDARKHRLRLAHQRGLAADGVDPVMSQRPVDAQRALEQTELAQAFGEAFARIPARSRTVARLRWVDRAGRAEIAERLGISVRTVDAHLWTAVKLLRKWLRGLTR